jgi:hypothetical protein
MLRGLTKESLQFVLCIVKEATGATAGTLQSVAELAFKNFRNGALAMAVWILAFWSGVNIYKHKSSQ